jgi:hypothetical protein
MDAKVEFPDSELSASPALGVIFRLPTQDNVDDSSDHDSYDDRRRCRIRPHSAKGFSFSSPLYMSLATNIQFNVTETPLRSNALNI